MVRAREPALPLAEQEAPKMSAAAERLMLLRNGTKPSELTPHSIYDTALADLGRRAFNLDLRKQKSALRKAHKSLDWLPKSKPYAFRAAEVNKATDAEHLLRLAVQNHGVSKLTSKYSVALLYSDVGKLQAAIWIAVKAPK